jgi:hypothetical protein
LETDDFRLIITLQSDNRRTSVCRANNRKRISLSSAVVNCSPFITESSGFESRRRHSRSFYFDRVNCFLYVSLTFRLPAYCTCLSDCRPCLSCLLACLPCLPVLPAYCACLPASLSFLPASVRPSVRPSFCPSVFLSVRLAVCPSFCPSVRPSVLPFVW